MTEFDAPPAVRADILLSAVDGIPKKLRGAMDVCGWETVGDVLAHVPRRYEDRRSFSRFPADPTDEPVTIHAAVVDVKTQRFGGRQRVFEATLAPAESAGMPGQQIVARWFNLPFMSKVIAVGQQLVAHGKIKQVGKRLVVDHPETEVTATADPLADNPQTKSIHLRRIVPVYRLSNGLQQRPLREFVHRLVTAMDHADPSAFPQVIPEAAAAGVMDDPLPSRSQMVANIHFPPDLESIEIAGRGLAMDELFLHQLHVVDRKRNHDQLTGARHAGRGELLAEFSDALPFPLTGAQKRAIREIRADLKSTHAMNRLLQGDVGSGKTVVAMASALLAVEAGWQVAVMAPTQILAEQHFLNFQKMLGAMDIKLALRTGAGIDHSHGAGDDAQIVIGTHALLFDKGELIKRDQLGLVVIDEQHKFGVEQRAKLQETSAGAPVPDVLVMTATPIPRTLQMTVYGDLDVSVIDEMPAGRGSIVTGIRLAPKVPDVTKFLKAQLELGRQAYLVYPLVEESEKLTAASAVENHEKWAKRLSKYEVGLLTGRTPADEKESIMKQFRDGRIDVLVSTTVIEVGVDVPNASVMIIHNANRFGLAQLHQLRGRIGRGEHASFCVMALDKKDADAATKLGILEETRDGFRIAEEDLRQRGPGDALGTDQSGLPDLSPAARAFIGDTRLLVTARKLAEYVFEHDPDLANPDHTHLRTRLAKDADPLGSRFANVG